MRDASSFKQPFWERFLTGPFGTIFASVSTTFIVAAFFFKLSGPVPISVSQTSVEKERSFDVQGEGVVSALPDQGEVNLGVRARGKTVKQVQDQANKVIKQIIEELEDLNIEKEDIKTTNYSIYPRYDIDDPEKIDSYEANARLEVKVKDFDKLSQAIDLATSLGANQVSGIQFSLSEEKEVDLKEEARKQAIDQAKKKAKQLAGLADIKLGRIINVIEESQLPQPRPINLRAISLEDQQSTPIEPGSAQLTVRITLSYETL